ncbi:MAG: transcription antitermination factor NusB [Actinobacteria bacterium]|nr:transcription antitermination factor NusB [Actinomycetota bacterium]
MSRPGRRGSEARERALHLLYEAEIAGLDPVEVLDRQVVPVDEQTARIVGSVARNSPTIGAMVSEELVGWTLERLSTIDRLVLFIATAELLDADGPPVAVILNEAVELAKRYSTDEAGRFVNGVLAAVARSARPRS